MSAGKAIERHRVLPKYDLDRNHAPVPTAKLAKRQCFRLVNTETGRKFIDAARECGTVPSALLVARSATRLGCVPETPERLWLARRLSPAAGFSASG
jgi:hypothetical protein